MIANAFGLEGAHFSQNNSKYYTVTLDLTQDSLNLYWKSPQGENFKNIPNLRHYLMTKNETLLFATNAGIYTENQTPLGLHIENNQVKVQLNLSNPKNSKGNFSLKPNGIFYVIDKKAYISETKQFSETIYTQKQSNNISLATQSGPLLLMNNTIHPKFLKDSDSRKFRNAVCIKNKTHNPHAVFFSISLTAVNFYEFALFLKEQMHCTDALYLDGTLSQIYNDNAYYGPPFWYMKPFVGILAVSKK